MKHLLIFIAAVVILLYQADKPFWGHHDFNNAFYGNMGRNLLRYPLWQTKLGQITNSGLVNPNDFTFHTHHPSLLVWSLVLSYILFGASEISTRLVPIVFSALTLVFFHSLMKKIFDEKTALITIVFWLATPIFIYFGKMAVQEILVLFFFVFSFWAYFFAPKLLLPALFLGALSGWPGYYTPFIIWLYDRKRLAVLAVPFLAFGLHLGHNWLLTGSVFGGGFDKAFSLRSGNVELWPYLRKELAWILAYFTRPLVILGLVGLLMSVKRRLVTAFLIFGLAHLVFFRQAAERHDYLIYYLLPVITLASALILRRFWFLAPAIVVMMVLTSYRFTVALIESNYDREAVLRGKEIRKKAEPWQTVEVFSNKIYNNSEPQLIFYADRKVIVAPDL